eukprot:8692344-Pyramimonas_sp.AAC.1
MCSDNAALVICTKCLSYSSRGRICGLAEKRAAPTRSKRYNNWHPVCRGLHPKRPGVTVERGPWAQLGGGRAA